jgi:predicted NBD/HSP70 family sugar kinase
VIDDLNQNIAMGIDIGGTSIKIALVDTKTGKITSKKNKIDTPNPSNIKNIIKLIFNQLEAIKWGGDIGCGFPGVVKDGVVKFVGNLHQDWIGINVERELRKNTTGRVRVINDADAAALAEMKFGAGKNYNNPNGGVVLILTLGTGIGSAIFNNGQLLPNTEFGQIELDGTIAEKKAATVVRAHENLSWKKWAKRVNRYLNHIAMILSPDLIIIGGGISSSPEKFFQYLDLKTNTVTAKLGSNAGIVGAALSVKTK